MLRVNNHASIVPKNVYGTNLSAKCSALLSTAETMPGLPKVPAAEKIDVDKDGKITGLF